MLFVPVALTISHPNVKKYVTKKDIRQVILLLKLKCNHLRVEVESYELSKEHRSYHYHALCYVPRNYWLKKLKVRGWSIHIDHLKSPEDTEKWVSYILKDNDHPVRDHQIELENYYNHHQYLFSS